METDPPPPPREGAGADSWSSWSTAAGDRLAGAWPAWASSPPPPPLLRPVPPHSRRHVLLCVGLFLLTVGSTYLGGGPAYAAAIMTILLTHEMGHYLMCRRYRVPSTLPLFIPMPYFSPFGTMGAIIFMTQMGQNRKALFDIGIAGPLAGMVPATAAVLWGLAHSTVAPAVASAPGVFHLGDSLLFLWFEKLVGPATSAGQELTLHPVAYAGWAGYFVTALNLLPIGQLDGGHVLYGLLGRRSRYVSLAILAGLVVMAIFYPQWWVLVAVLVFFIGPRHSPTLDDSVPLDGRRVALGIFALSLLVLCFTPQPFSAP